MNKRGTTIFIALMLGVLFFVLGMAIAPALNDTTDQASHNTELNCSNTSISSQDKAVCTSIDSQNLFIPFIFGLGGLLVGGILRR